MRGFWTDFTNKSSFPPQAIRCPPGYCDNDARRLQPPLTIDRNPNSLCSRNRVGNLCGGCPPNFTQSMDERTCIRNEVCMENLWWVWTVSTLGYALYSLFIVLTCGDFGDNALTCLLFYLQVALFASIPEVQNDDQNDSSWFLRISQVQSLVTFASETCFAPSMSAYHATASKLIGPLFVLAFSAVWTWILRALQPRLLQRNIKIRVSYSGTFTETILFVFSSVASVVFTLVECTSYDSDGVVFIDGTVPCLDNNWKGLMVVVVLLCLVPVAFFAALWLNKLPEDARAVVCRAFTEPMFYWETLTLAFRLLISVIQFLQVAFPSLLAFMRMMFSLVVLILLVNLRPHLFTHTLWLDVVCYGCLVAQFGLQTFSATFDNLGLDVLPEQRGFYSAMRTLSNVFRFAC
jgi:hypothetical protein